MSRFIAIPVGQGDAFYLEREDFSVLVDGGRSRQALAPMFREATKKQHVDVVVCTHNDADHANGIIGFLESGLRCDEVWLPGRWLSVLPNVLEPFGTVFEQLARDIPTTLNSNFEDALKSAESPIEAYAASESVSSSGNGDGEGELAVGDDGWPGACVEKLESAYPWGPWEPGCWSARWYWDYWRRSYHGRLGPEGDQLLWSAIDAAARIRAIALKAFHQGIPVRWFEFSSAANAQDGRPGMLEPVNARAVATVRPCGSLFLAFLALSASNRESLVYWAPPAAGRRDGVLFTADSDLAGVNLPNCLQGAVVTAPHHGSQANADAYAAVQGSAQIGSQVWVRSDGRYRTRPGAAYLGLQSRLCTLCRDDQAAKKAVRLYSRLGRWTRNPGTTACSCR